MPDPVWTGRTVIQLAILGTAFGNAVVNVFHFQVGTAVEATLTTDALARAQCTTLVTSWGTNMATLWNNAHSPDYTVSSYRAQVLERPGNWRHRLTPVEVLAGAGNTGDAATPAESMTDAVVWRWRTDRAGKSYRGRSYLGPVPTGYYADGRLTTLGTTQYTATAQRIKDRWCVGGTLYDTHALTIYSRPYNTGEYGYATGHHPTKTFYYPPEYAGAATNVADFSVDSILRNQRRRQIGVGA